MVRKFSVFSQIAKYKEKPNLTVGFYVLNLGMFSALEWVFQGGLGA
jgi:hypothetical protein